MLVTRVDYAYNCFIIINRKIFTISLFTDYYLNCIVAVKTLTIVNITIIKIKNIMSIFTTIIISTEVTIITLHTIIMLIACLIIMVATVITVAIIIVIIIFTTDM